MHAASCPLPTVAGKPAPCDRAAGADADREEAESSSGGAVLLRRLIGGPSQRVRMHPFSLMDLTWRRRRRAPAERLRHLAAA